MAATQQQTSTSSNGHSAAVTALGAEKQSTDALQAKSTHHAPRKRLFTKLQALVTSPKRADGLGAAIAGALKGRPRHDSNTNDEPETKYRERLASDASLNSGPHESRPNKQSPTSLSPSQASGLSATNEAASPSSLPTSHSSEGVYLTSSPVKRVDKLGLPGSTSVHTARSVKPVSDQEQRKPELPRIITEDVVAPGPQTLLRPHLKLRIVTW